MKNQASKQNTEYRSKLKAKLIVENNLNSDDKKNTLSKILGRELFVFLNKKRLER